MTLQHDITAIMVIHWSESVATLHLAICNTDTIRGNNQHGLVVVDEQLTFKCGIN